VGHFRLASVRSIKRIVRFSRNPLSSIGDFTIVNEGSGVKHIIVDLINYEFAVIKSDRSIYSDCCVLFIRQMVVNSSQITN